MGLGGTGSAATVYVDVEGDLTKFKKDVSGAGGVASKELGGGKMALAGKVAGGAIVGGITAALVGGISGAVEAETAKLDLAASLGLDAGSDRVAELTGISTGLYRNAWGETLDDVNVAVQSAYAAFGDEGFYDPAELERLSEQGLAIADVFQIDVAEAMGFASTVFSSGLTKDNPEEAFDVFVRAAQKVPEALRGELIDAGNEYSQFFADLGFSSEQAFGVLAAGADDGAYGIDKAGDAVKEFSIRATDGSKASTAALEELGLDGGIVANQLLAGGDVARGAFDNIVEGILAIDDPSSRAATAIALFGTPLEDLGVNDIPVFLEGLISTSSALEDVEGASQELADTVGGSTQASFEALKRKGLGILADFATGTLLPAIDTLLPVLDGFLTAIDALPAPFKTAAVVGGLFVGSVLLFAGPLLKVIQIVKLTSGAFSLLAANPWTLVIIAAVAAVFLIVKYWDEIKAALVATWDFIAGKASEVWNAISGIVQAAGSLVESYVNTFYIRPIELLIGIFQAIPGAATAAWNGVLAAVEAVAGKIISAIDSIKSAASSALGPVGDVIGFGGKIGGFVGGIPGFDSGGVVPGPRGAPTLALVHGGETILPTHKDPSAGMGGGGVSVTMQVSSEVRDPAFFERQATEIARVVSRELNRERRAQGRATGGLS